jgi:ABC-2 type transport system ATP-binding protein
MLYDKRNVQSGTFSGGMKQRLSVAAGLVHSPSILFMDEPTTGLDPQSRIALRELTQSLNKSGITIIYTTHDMEEADKICQRIAIMDYGKLIALGTSDELKETQEYGCIIKLEVGRHSPSLLDELKSITGASSIAKNGNRIELKIRKMKPWLVHRITEHLSAKGVSLEDLSISQPTLEDVFISLTKKELRD